MNNERCCHIYNTDVYSHRNIADYINHSNNRTDMEDRNSVRSGEMASYLHYRSYICSDSVVMRSELCIK